MADPRNDNFQSAAEDRPRAETRRIARIVAFTMLVLFLLIFALLAVVVP